jgi:hypothetical protein
MKRFILPLALAILTLTGCLAPDLPSVPEVNSDFKPPETTSKPQAFITETNPLFTGRESDPRITDGEFILDDLELFPEADDESDADLYADSDSRWYELSGQYAFPILYSEDNLLSLGTYAASGLTGNDYLYSKYHLHIGSSDYAVNNLLFGDADAAMLRKLTPEQEQTVFYEKTFELGSQKIGYTGLVFFTDPTNEIENVSADLLRRIYSGEIKNWADLGGEDRAINPFQNDDESSAQFYMEYSFMNGTQMIPPQKAAAYSEGNEEYQSVAEYKNLPGAIGYAIYSQVLREQANAGNIKLLSVNGVKPTPETLRDGSYPIASETYIYYDANNTGAKTLADWFVSKEGQTAVVRAGYYPVSEIALLPENKAYKAIGTGAPKSESAPFTGKSAHFTNLSNGEIDFLHDKALEKEINAWILDKADGSENILTLSSIENGYLSVKIMADNYKNDREYPTAVWDIIGKRKIKNFSDLFYKDSDYSLTLGIAAASSIEMDYIGNSREKTDFVGFAGEIEEDAFGTGNFTVYGESAYYTDEINIVFTLEYDLNSVVCGYRNFDDALADGYSAYDSEFANVF